MPLFRNLNDENHMKTKRLKWDWTDELQLAGIGEDGTKPG